MRKLCIIGLFCCFFGAQAQEKGISKVISGRITGPGKSLLPGATIVVRGTRTGTTTSVDGSFSIQAKEGDVLEVSHVGYLPQAVPITNSDFLTISLTETLGDLNEIVVLGYTTQRIKDITGSVAVVKFKDLSALPAGQLEQMLQGRVAGLNVITSGMPGGASNVRLHGIGNFGDVTPLYIIDGVQGDINNLNPTDIESIQVLKDAGASAIYGVRGANGVIIVTTRNGRQGKTKISYHSYAGTTRPLKGLDLLNPSEMLELVKLASTNSSQPFPALYGKEATPLLPDYFIAGENIGLSANDPLTNPDLYNRDFAFGKEINQIVQTNKEGTGWFRKVFRPAFSQNHSLTLSGANDQNQYLLSLGFLNQQGTMLNTFLKRYTVRINTQFSPTKSLRVGENVQLTARENPRIVAESNSDDNEIVLAMMSSPLLPVYDIKGGWAHFSPKFYYDNPVATRTLAKDDKGNLVEILGNVFAEADILRTLTFRTSFGGNWLHYNRQDFTSYTYHPRVDSLPDNSLLESSNHQRSWTWTNTLKLSTTLNGVHKFGLLGGTEAISNYNREVGGRSAGFFSSDVDYRFLSNGVKEQTNFSLAGRSALFSWIGRLDYGFNEKYYITATLRHDGSSVFGPQKRYGLFPSVSAAWRISDEKFMQFAKSVKELKFRGSWGKTGYYGNTDPLNQFTLYGGSRSNAYYDIYGTGNNPVQGFRAVRLGAPNTGWQEDVVTNIGLETILWNGKLSFTADWYRKKASGLLFPVALPDVLGGATPPNANVGSVLNKGFDVLLGSKGRWAKELTWDATLTITTYQNKILKVNNLPFYIPSQMFGGSEVFNRYVRNQVGQAVSSFYGFKITGIFKDADEVSRAPIQQAAAPGRFRYLDANSDGEINGDDRVFIGNANPKFTTGIQLGMTYKNIDFSTSFYGSFGNDVINLSKYWTDIYAMGPPFVLFSARGKAALYESWTPQRTQTAVPIAETERNFSNVAEFNSYGLENGSYFRSKSVILGFTLPKSLLQKRGLESLRIYLQAMNLFTLTTYSGLDPELSGQSAAFGIDYGNYPNNQKQYLFGININF